MSNYWSVSQFKLQTLQWKVWRYQRGNQNRISKKDRQHNVQKKKDKGTNNDLQNTTQKTKEQATQAPLRHGGEPSNLIFIDKCSGFC